MAYSFLRSSTQYLIATSAATAAPPASLFARFWWDGTNATTNHFLLSLGNSAGGGESLQLRVRADTSGLGNKLSASQQDASAASDALSSGYVTPNTWNTGLAVFASSTSTRIYLNGTDTALDATAVTISGMDRTTLGVLMFGGTLFGLLDGRLAECAIWSVALNAADAIALNHGKSPLALTDRLGSLVFYRDLVRNINGGWSIGPSLTNTNGAAVVTHPPKVIPYSFRRRLVVPGAAAAVGNPWNYYALSQ